uniref:Thiol-disulfide oxidoreductase DCC n=1 Tax=Kalanchoe fedtschenkoi TaxID=63787 RepID=A0A7N0UJR1_KALFE
MAATARTILRLRYLPASSGSAAARSRLLSAFRPASDFSFSTSPAPRVASGAAAEDLVDDEDGALAAYAETVALPAAVELPNMLQPRVVIFDGVCNLCHTGVKWVIRADKHRKIKFCCLQSKAAEPYMEVCGVEREDVLRRFLFVEGLDQYHQGSTAALKVMSYLPLPYSALSTLSVIPVPLRDAVYDFVARRRYKWFGKGEKCLILKDIELLDRFVDKDEILDQSRPDCE